MEKKTWKKTVLSILIVAASFFYTGVAQAGVPPPLFSKNFAPDPITTGATSTLTFTIDNSGLAAVVNNLDFTDNLPVGVVIATPSNDATTCTGGTLTATAGSGVISYTGGTVGASSICTVQADVTSSTATTHVNTSSLLSTSLGTSGPATDTLTVNAPPPIPTLPQWGMILLTLSLLTMATWQLAGRPIVVGAGSSGTVALLSDRRQWLTSLLLGQGIATLGLGLYALLLGPLVPHDGVGAFLSGLLIGVMVECYRRSWSR